MNSNSQETFVLGGGISGRSALALLSRLGESAQLVDKKEGTIDSEENANLYLHSSKNQRIIKSPGVPPHHPWIQRAQSLGIPVLSEIDLGFEVSRGYSKSTEQVAIGITGTDGKSTTTALTHHILRASFPNKQIEMGGNIGRPFTEFSLTKWDIAVLELSSYQLEDSRPNLTRVSAFLNIAPDHLERHGTMDNYIKAKSRIAYRDDESAILIINRKTLPLATPYLENYLGKFLVFESSEDSPHSSYTDSRIHGRAMISQSNRTILTNQFQYITDRFPLPGYHNLENLAAAILICESVGCDSESIQNALQDFAGLPHRFEEFLSIHSWRFVNDSKSTNLHSLLSWLEPQPNDTGKLYLLIGGRPKDEPIQPLIDTLKGKNVEIYLYGEACEIWGNSFRVFGQSTHIVETMEEGLILIKSEYLKNKDTGSLVVLSPACASFDQFRNFEERGNHFKSLVTTLFSD